MRLKLEIRRNSDGLIAVDFWDNWDWHSYWWEDGNAACDCNRELLFLRAIKADDNVETECGQDRYSVRLSDADSGEILYDEFD